jgi:hypothetical protein
MAKPEPNQPPLSNRIAALLLDGGVSGSPGTTAILAELRRRTGQDLGADPQAWRDWFLRTHPSDEVGRLWLQFAETRRRIREIERRALRKLRR